MSTRRDRPTVPEIVIPVAVPVEAINTIPISIFQVEAQLVPPPLRIPGSVWGPTCQKCGKQFERNLNLIQSDANYYHCSGCSTYNSQSCAIH